MAVFFVLVLLFGCSRIQISGNVVKETIPSEISKEMEVYFCPSDNCEGILINVIICSLRIF